MNERIDHLIRAENAMQNGIKLRNAGIIQDATFQAALANASATLALVEQQRIANLIALHRHEVKYDIGSWSRLYDTDPGSEAVLKPEIAEGLGLS